MSTDSDYAIVLDKMLDYEKKLHLIYNGLALKFSEMKDFWRDLSADENTHALMIESIMPLYTNDSDFIKKRSVSLESTENNLKRADEFLQKLNNDQVSQKCAFEFAIEAESSMVERDIFRYYADDPDDLKKIFKVLHEQSRGHFKKIEEQYKTCCVD